jgi:hypothetical protein
VSYVYEIWHGWVLGFYDCFLYVLFMKLGRDLQGEVGNDSTIFPPVVSSLPLFRGGCCFLLVDENEDEDEDEDGV